MQRIYLNNFETNLTDIKAAQFCGKMFIDLSGEIGNAKGHIFSRINTENFSQ
jgi:hypothetical protein